MKTFNYKIHGDCSNCLKVRLNFRENFNYKITGNILKLSQTERIQSIVIKPICEKEILLDLEELNVSFLEVFVGNIKFITLSPVKIFSLFIKNLDQSFNLENIFLYDSFLNIKNSHKLLIPYGKISKEENENFYKKDFKDPRVKEYAALALFAKKFKFNCQSYPLNIIKDSFIGIEENKLEKIIYNK
jgi:hypothetical protein